MLNVKDIRLTEEELVKCIEFSRTSAPNQQAIEFGQRTTKARSSQEIARDNLIGKIAEIAFSKMMKENYGIDVALDFNYYPRGKWDDQDAIINGWRIDIKGTRKGGHWMLIEWNKLNFRQHHNNLSHVYLMFTVDWDRNKDLPTGKVSYEGAVSLEKLRHSCPTTRILRKGDLIPGTNTRLQADNYGIHYKDLYKHLNHLVAYLVDQEPASTLTADFRNPYTGKTTSEVASVLPSKEHIQSVVDKSTPTQNQHESKRSLLSFIAYTLYRLTRKSRHS